MSAQLVFDTVFLSSDGGEDVFELRTTVGEIVSMYDAGYLEVGNIRPDHAKVVTKRGERFKRTSDRQKRWTEQLSRGRGILGNLSWNADPTRNEIEWDEDEQQLIISGADGGQPILHTPDSATRHRAIIDAVKAQMRTIDLDRHVSVRLWLVPAKGSDPNELTEPAVFDSYNQDGKPVNATVAKHAFQRDALERLIYNFAETSPHLGLDNVENIQNSVSRESSKLVAYNTLVTAFKDGFARDIEGQDREDAELAWLLQFWDELVGAVPELGRVSLAQRKEYRRDSVAGSATLIHAYIRLANHLREQGLPPETVRGLADLKVTLNQGGLRTQVSPTTGQPESISPAGTTVGYFSPDNPLWTGIGVIVPKARPDGSTSAEVRNAFQTRQAAARALIDAVAPAATKTKQEAVDQLAELIGAGSMDVGIGSSLPSDLFDRLAEFAGVEPGPMPIVGERVAEAAGLAWTRECDSRHTTSGGGSTVTLAGLMVLIEAAKVLKSR